MVNVFKYQTDSELLVNGTESEGTSLPVKQHFH